MNPEPSSRPPLPTGGGGFALVITLSLMVLLAVIVVGLSTLASISLRGSSGAAAMASARANARLSLLLAVGQLQRQAGADTRVSARADILDEKNPPVLGVWKSWEGGDHEQTGACAGRPVSPGNYGDEKTKRFLGWLTSANGVAPSELPATTRMAGRTVTLLGEGSVGSGKDRDQLQIHLTPTPVESGTGGGAMAWWVGGENQKARLPQPYQPTTNNSSRLRAEWAIMAKSHATADPGVFKLDSLLTDASLTDPTIDGPASKAITRAQADLLHPPQSRAREFFHDLSTSAVGLLTNTATGGWRKDLSLLSESWDRQPTGGLPLFRVKPDPAADTEQARATLEQWDRRGSLFYPWAAYTRNYSGGLQQAVASWNNLIDFTRFYQRAEVTTKPSGVRGVVASAVSHHGGQTNQEFHDNLHKVRVFPVVARIQWVFSHFAEEAGNDPANPGERLLTPKLLMTPVITIWNPYDAELTPDQNLNFELKILPIAFNYQVGNARNSRYNCVLYVNDTTKPLTNIPSLLDYGGNGQNKYATCIINKGDLVLKPGETRVFSPGTNDRKVPSVGPGGPGGSSYCINLLPGYRGTGGHLYPVRNQDGEVGPKPAATPIKANARFDTKYNAFTWGSAIIRAEGCGVYLEMSPPNAAGNWSDSTYTIHYRTSYSPAIADLLHPPIGGNDMLGTTLAEVRTTPLPFISAIFGTRMTTKTHDATKGFVQCSPFGHFSPTYYRDTSQYRYTGTGHPINSRFDYSFVAHTSGNDDNLPNAGNSNNNGFIITGVRSSDGMPRCVVAELPSRPLASLGELVNWDLRFENPAPPFAFNLVGNSDATPLLPANAVVNAGESSKAENFKTDDSYCANHLLFDDWFVSSITPDPRHFGSVIDRSQQRVFTEFLKQETPLANHAYKPIAADLGRAAATDGGAADVFMDHVAPPDSWKTIASRLEVEGMFNVNSTSVTAWRALLRHARNQRIPYIRSTNASWAIQLSPETDHPFSRFSIAGDVEAGTPVAGVFPEASELTGYRTLDDELLDELAEQIVKQVRLRGPFLSLAEFVNRQLSNDSALALAGAIQAALNELTSGARNPLAALQGVSVPAVAAVPEGADAEDRAAYVFPDAAKGYNTYGVPGWTRQADILRPLAPVLSARDDTFVVRGYGDARDHAGRVTAHAVCEAVVRRTRAYVDPADAADITGAPESEVNKVFGRRFEIVSFRWLAPNEV